MSRFIEHRNSLDTTAVRVISLVSDRQAAFEKAGTTAQGRAAPVRASINATRAAAAPAQSLPASATPTPQAIW